MSDKVEDAANAASPPANASEGDENDLKVESKNLSTEDLLAQVARLTSTNERLLDESKRYKSQSREFKEKLDSQQKQTLEEQGKYKELYEGMQQKYQEQEDRRMKLAVKSAVKEHAVKAGCVDPEALLKLSDVSMLQYDPETDTVSGMDLLVDRGKKDFSYLFKSQINPSINPAAPGGASLGTGKLTASEIAKMDPTQRQKLLVEMEKQGRK